jgi:hypothetical protein
MSILANHLLVVQTVSVEKSIIKQYALVCQLMLEVLQAVDLNVLSAQNVLQIRLVKTKNVKILVLILVAQTLSVVSITIVQFAHAKVDTLVIHSLDAIQFHVRIS